MKRINKTTAAVELKAIFTKPTVTTTWLDESTIENAKNRLLMTEQVTTALETKADPMHEYAFRQFIETPNDRLASILNKLHAYEEHLQVEVGKLAYKLTPRKNRNFNAFQNAQIAPIMAFMIMTALMEVGAIETEVKTLMELDEDTGKKTWRNQTFVTFGHSVVENKMYIKGLALEPTVIQKTTKVRPGGKATKLSGKEKLFLKNAGSTPLRLIDIDPEQIAEYLRSSEWYQKVLNNDPDVKMDIIIADDLIAKQVAKFTAMQTLDSFYLPLWLDYRTRLYYELVEMGFNPHGKTFETSLYELAEPKYITNTGFENLAYSAVAIVEGRMSHKEAIDKFNLTPGLYLDALKSKSGDMGKDLYNSRLAQAIEDYYNEVPSHFLLGEDATNGGLQHHGIGFKAPMMMKPSNVGGESTQQDSHTNLQMRLGLKERQEAKDIHQPLLHGSSMRTVAKVMGKTVPETRVMLKEGYGAEVFNIEKIADWGVKAVDNNNTSLMWTTADGFKAQSIAYTESVPLELYAMSSNTKSGYTQIKIHRDMPLIQDAKGNPIYGSVTNDGEEDKTMGKSNKLRGLDANITHSIDATGLRTVIRTVKHENQDNTAGGIWKHDNFLVHPNDMTFVRQGYKSALIAEFHGNYYQSALEQIASNFVGEAPMLPTLVMGDATVEMIENSNYFLAP